MKKRRSTFRSRNGTPSNEHVFARRRWNDNLTHYQFLHHETRQRSASELDAMRLAAQRRPHGWAARYLAGQVATSKPAVKRARTKKTA